MRASPCKQYCIRSKQAIIKPGFPALGLEHSLFHAAAMQHAVPVVMLLLYGIIEGLILHRHTMVLRMHPPGARVQMLRSMQN